MSDKVERRYVSQASGPHGRGADIRIAQDGKTLKGYAIVWNVLSQDLGGFKERILPNAVENPNDDVRCLYNHNDDLVLGRTKSKTLVLRPDSIGLGFELAIPDTTTGRDLRTLVQRGDVAGCSFGFRVGRNPSEQEWGYENGQYIRTVKRLTLLEVSPCGSPAYLQTTIGVRSDIDPNGPLGRYAAELDYQEKRLQLDMLMHEIYMSK